MDAKFALPIARAKSSLICAIAITTLAACSSSRPPLTSDMLVQQANEAMGSGAQDKAADLLLQATRLNPTSDTVWVKLAQAQFERQDYPKAIDAATEALARTPASTEARSIIFVSSMRLAVSSLNDIRADTPLSDSNKSEAETLVKELRETLGESVLIPGAKALTKTQNKPRLKARPVQEATPAGKPPTTQANAAADPFGSLR